MRALSIWEMEANVHTPFLQTLIHEGSRGEAIFTWVTIKFMFLPVKGVLLIGAQTADL